MKILSESSVAAGVRRIELVCGKGVLAHLAERDEMIENAARTLKASTATELGNRANAVMGEIASLKKTVDELNSKMASSKLDEIIANAEIIGAVKFAAVDLGEMSLDAVRALGDKIKDKAPDTAALFAIRANGKLNFLAFCGKDAVANGAHAGNIVRAAATVCGGKGGGRPDSAQAGGADESKVAEALAEAKKIIK